MGSTCAIADDDRSRFHTDFIPQTSLDKRLVGLPTTLDNKRLDAVLIEVVHELWQRPLARQDDALGVRANPMTDSQLGMFADIGSMSYQYGILLCTKLMGEHLRLLIADLEGLTLIVDETIGSLRPLQDDVRAMLGMKGEETTVQPLALLFQNTHSHLNACLANLCDTPTLHFSKRVDATHDNSF